MFVSPFQFSSVMSAAKSFANRGGGSAFCRRMVRYTPSSAYSDSAKVCKAGCKSRSSGAPGLGFRVRVKASKRVLFLPIILDGCCSKV
jgi:hypothetical protein